MLRLLVAVLVLLSGAAAAQAPYPPNEQPMYGGQPKTEAMRAADEAFIRNVEATMSRPEGASRSSAAGFQAFFRGDMKEAMRRFNQAWLLNPQHANAYHGFALVLLERDGDAAGGEAMFKRALALPDVQGGTHTDYGRLLMMTGRPAQAAPVLESALAKPGAGPDTLPLLASAYFESGNVQKGCAIVAQALPSASGGLRNHLQQLRQRGRCE